MGGFYFTFQFHPLSQSIVCAMKRGTLGRWKLPFQKKIIRLSIGTVKEIRSYILESRPNRWIH